MARPGAMSAVPMGTGEPLGKMSDLMMEETLRLILDLMSLKEA